MSDEILKKYLELAMGGLPTVKQRLDICNDVVTEMAIEASRVCIKRWGRPISDITHLVCDSLSPQVKLDSLVVIFTWQKDLDSALRRNGSCSISWAALAEKIGFKVAGALPQIIEENVESFCEKLMATVELTDKDYNQMFWAVHPGGHAILNRIEKRLDLFPDKLNASRRALMDYGNASSNTIVYVLEYMIEGSLKRMTENQDEDEWGLILAFGPGITIKGILARNLTV
ncbi:hypothetical protein DITRI_Ditri01bG0040400 [Diplodiscus trichospermus]